MHRQQAAAVATAGPRASNETPTAAGARPPAEAAAAGASAGRSGRGTMAVKV